jgi:hypothetical protein
MPQFDFFSFFVQIIWLTIGSFCFYLMYLKFFLKNSSEAIKIRQKVSIFFEKGKTGFKSLWNTAMDFFRKNK